MLSLSVRNRVGCVNDVVILFWAPVAQVVLGVVENLPGLLGMVISRTHIAWDDGRVIEELQESSAMLGQDNLLFGPLDGSSKLGLVSLLELLSSLQDIAVSR